jgi:hypothetical protein
MSDPRDYQLEVLEPELPQTIAINEGLMSEALRQIDPVMRPPVILPDNQRTTDVSRAFLVALIEHLGDGLDGCDHRTGICQCEALAIHAELKLALAGELSCPDCKGEGFTWSEDTMNARIEAAAAETGESAEELRKEWWIQHWGNEKCARCGSSGVVRREQ